MEGRALGRLATTTRGWGYEGGARRRHLLLPPCVPKQPSATETWHSPPKQALSRFSSKRRSQSALLLRKEKTPTVTTWACSSPRRARNYNSCSWEYMKAAHGAANLLADLRPEQPSATETWHSPPKQGALAVLLLPLEEHEPRNSSVARAAPAPPPPSHASASARAPPPPPPPMPQAQNLRPPIDFSASRVLYGIKAEYLQTKDNDEEDRSR